MKILIKEKILISFYSRIGFVIERRIEDRDEWKDIININWSKYNLFLMKYKHKTLLILKNIVKKFSPS